MPLANPLKGIFVCQLRHSKNTKFTKISINVVITTFVNIN